MFNKRLIELAGKNMKYVYLQVMCKVLILVFHIVLSFTLVNLIKAISDYDVGFGFAFLCLVIIDISLNILMLSFRYQNYFAFKTNSQIKWLLREKIYQKLLSLGSSFRGTIASSSLMQLAIEGVDQLETYFGAYLPQLFYSVLAPLILFAVMAFVNIKVAAILLIFVPLIPISIVLVQKIAKRIMNKYFGIYLELGNHFHDYLLGLNTLKINGAEQIYLKKADEEAENFRKITMRVLIMQLNSVSVMDIMAYGGSAAGLIIALLEFKNGTLDLYGCLLFILLSAEFFLPMRLLGSYFHIAMNGISASEKIFNFLDLEVDEKGNKTLIKNQAIDIELDGVSYSYNNDITTLKNISFSLPQSKMVALVGRSGCGKSTIASILSGRINNYQGSIKIQNKELRTIADKDLHAHVNLLCCNSFIFKGTVRDNLKMAADLDDSVLIKALEVANLADLDLDYQINDGATNLSGGQKQRLAFARSLLFDSEIYLFDECASNIDIESETLILNQIKQLAKHKTILMIAHRLSSVKDCDYIYFMHEGKIVEEGTHDYLMSLNGYYAKMYRTQDNLERLVK